MKIVEIFYSFPSTLGGSETQVYPSVRYLSNRGHKIEVIVITQDASTPPQSKNIRFHRIYPKRIGWYYDLYKLIKEIESDGKVDVFEIHMMHYALAIPRNRKIILSLHLHDPFCPYIYFPHSKEGYLSDEGCFSFFKCRRCVGSLKYLKWKMIQKYALRKIAKYMVKRQQDRELFMKFGVEKSCIELVPFWINAENIFKSSTAESIFEDLGHPRFGFLSRLDRPKGALLALKAFRMLIQKGKNASLIIIGDGPQRKELEMFVRNNGFTDGVKFVGAIPHPDVFRYFSEIDIFLQVQLYSNYGWSLLESMNSGKPIIATDVGETRDILEDNCNAILCEPTPESLCEKMGYIMENPEIGKKIAKNALKKIREEHSLKNLERYEKLLYKVAGNEE